MVTGGAEQVRHRVSAGADQRVGAIIAWLLLMLFFSVAAGVSDGDTGAIKKGRVQDDAPTRPVEPRGRRSQGEPGADRAWNRSQLDHGPNTSAGHTDELSVAWKILLCAFWLGSTWPTWSTSTPRV